MISPKLCLVLPCFNEENVLVNSFEKLTRLYEDLINRKIIQETSFIVFVDDGSVDSTWEQISELRTKSKYVKGIKLSRNYGHQNAILAGLSSSLNNADCYITIDVDLQDDISAIGTMI